MMDWSGLAPEEIERRRLRSNTVMRERRREEFEAWYQEQCDRTYWRLGPCCAGCDHWQSAGGRTGECSAAGIMSGVNVLRSIGISFASYIPKPGFPFTREDHRCGLFRDNFDWSKLDSDYLTKIGATRNGELRKKPTP